MADATVLSDVLADAVAAAGGSVARVDGRCGGTTGTVWSADGVVVAAHHAVDRDEDLTVTLGDGRVLPATVAGRDPGTDIVVLRVAATDLPAPRWSDGEGLRVGHLALVLGRPGKTVRATLGIVSALGETFRTPAGARIDRYLEVDASLPRGYSGGPLVDTTGAVLGINSAAVVRGGITVPTVTLRRVVGEILASGRVGRGYLGVGVYPVRLPDARVTAAGQRGGLVVVSLESGGPAEAAGFLVGDVLLGLDGTPLERPGDLTAALDGRSGVETTAQLLRAGAPTALKVTPGARG